MRAATESEYTTPRFGALKLLTAVGAVAFIWLVVLPAVAEKPSATRYIQWLDEQRIDPSAMYYTELPMMEPLLEKLATKQAGTGQDMPATVSSQ